MTLRGLIKQITTTQFLIQKAGILMIDCCVFFKFKNLDLSQRYRPFPMSRVCHLPSHLHRVIEEIPTCFQLICDGCIYF